MILSTNVWAFADNASITQNTVEDVTYREVLYQTSLGEITQVVGSDQIEALKSIYYTVYTNENEADTGFQDVIISINMQAKANNFTDEQIKAMVFGLIDSTEDALTKDLMEYSDTPPVAPPSHEADRIFDQLAAEGSPDVVTVTLNGKVLHIDQPPILENGRTLVPIRVIFEEIGAKVDWNQETQTVSVTKQDINVSLKIGSDQLIRNGNVIKLDVPARIVNSRTLIPVRAVAESLDLEVDWNQQTRTVIIETGQIRR